MLQIFFILCHYCDSFSSSSSFIYSKKSYCLGFFYNFFFNVTIKKNHMRSVVLAQHRMRLAVSGTQ